MKVMTENQEDRRQGQKEEKVPFDFFFALLLAISSAELEIGDSKCGFWIWPLISWSSRFRRDLIRVGPIFAISCCKGLTHLPHPSFASFGRSFSHFFSSPQSTKPL